MALRERVRIKGIARDPHATIAITSEGTSVCRTIVLEFIPEMSISFDGGKMAGVTAQAYAEFVAQNAKEK